MKSKVFGTVFHNFYYKAGALLLASLLWYIVQGEEILEINRRLVVNIKVPDGYIVKGAETRIKDVQLHGSRVLLGDYSNKPLEATIDIHDGKIGPQRFRIDHANIKNWDRRIGLTVIDPYVTVFVDERVSKKVPVKEYLKGVPADGSMIEKTTIKPNLVTITGPKTELAKIDQVLSEPIDVEGLSATKSFDAKLISKDMPKTTISAESATVTLVVGEKKINRRFNAVPVEVTGSGYQTNVKPRQISIVIQGTPGVLNLVKREDFQAFIEARELTPGTKNDRAVQVKIPADTTLIETIPALATVEVYTQKRLN